MTDEERDIMNQMTQLVVSLEGSEGGQEWFDKTGVDPEILTTLNSALIPITIARATAAKDMGTLIGSFEAMCMAAFSAGYDFAMARATGGTHDKS